MPDKKGLERIGVAFSVLTAVVMLTAAVVVKNNLGTGKPPIISASLGALLR